MTNDDESDGWEEESVELRWVSDMQEEISGIRKTKVCVAVVAREFLGKGAH